MGKTAYIGGAISGLIGAGGIVLSFFKGLGDGMLYRIDPVGLAYIEAPFIAGSVGVEMIFYRQLVKNAIKKAGYKDYSSLPYDERIEIRKMYIEKFGESIGGISAAIGLAYLMGQAIGRIGIR